MANDLTKQQREDLQKAMQEVTEHFHAGESLQEIARNATERAIRNGRERDEAVRLLNDVDVVLTVLLDDLGERCTDERKTRDKVRVFLAAPSEPVELSMDVCPDGPSEGRLPCGCIRKCYGHNDSSPALPERQQFAAGEVLMHTSNANFDRFKAAERQLAELQNDLVLSGHERNILMNSLVKCGCKQDPQCPDQWYNERAETAERQLAQINESRPFALLRRYGSLGAGMDSNYYYSCKDADPELNRLTQQNRALRLQLEKLQKRFDSAWDHIAATSIALGTPVGMNNADYAAQLKLDNAQKDARIAELESRKA